jgi:hypothetical protein
LITNTCQTRITLALMVFLGIPAVTHAQIPSELTDHRLKNYSPVRIVIEQLDDDARQCGITADGLDAAVRLPLSASPVKVVNDVPSSDGYVYANVNVLKLNNGVCVANVELEAHRWAMAFWSDVIVWTNGTMLSGAHYDFIRGVDNALEDLTKQFIGAWLKTNPR